VSTCVLIRCQVADGVTWPSEKMSPFQFSLSRELMTGAAYVNIVCEVSICYNNNDSSTGSTDIGDVAISQVGHLCDYFWSLNFCLLFLDGVCLSVCCQF